MRQVFHSFNIVFRLAKILTSCLPKPEYSAVIFLVVVVGQFLSFKFG